MNDAELEERILPRDDGCTAYSRTRRSETEAIDRSLMPMIVAKDRRNGCQTDAVRASLSLLTNTVATFYFCFVDTIEMSIAVGFETLGWMEFNHRFAACILLGGGDASDTDRVGTVL